MSVPFTFPVWIFVNLRNKSQDGYQYYPLLIGDDSAIPITLPVFPTKEGAETFMIARRGTAWQSPDVEIGEPFTTTELDVESFREILREVKGIKQIGVEIGTPRAALIPIGELPDGYQ